LSSEVIDVVVSALFTWCGVAGELALPLKFESPAYVAVRFFAPAVVDASEHEPADAAAVQTSVPSETVTLPVGVPAPGLFTVTLKFTVYDWPTTVGSGESPVIVVVVSAAFTSCGVVGVLALPAKFVSPAYVAVRFFAPALVNVTLHWPALAAAVHELVPSETVTFPVGNPEPGAFTATVY
jgi:hypothetical protein